MRKRNAFTLIELLVVIAIIAILAAVVLVSLSGARTRAKDARIISSMGQIRTGAEVFYSQNGNYDTFDCTTTSPVNISTLCTDIATQNAAPGTQPTIAEDDGDQYCAYVVMATTSPATWYCTSVNATQGSVADETTTDPSTVCDDTVAPVIIGCP